MEVPLAVEWDERGQGSKKTNKILGNGTKVPL